MRYFYVRIEIGTSSSTFNIYHDSVSSGNIVDVYDPATAGVTPATNLTYAQLTTGSGVLVRVPDTAETIILRDLNGFCPDIINPVPLYAVITSSDATCYDGATGSITISSIIGGSGTPYQTKLNSTGTYTTFSAPKVYSYLTAGSYDVYIKDSSGTETYYTETISEPTQLSADLTIISYPTTGGTTGTITLSSTGGTFNKTYRLYEDTSYPYSVGCGDTLYGQYTGTSATPTVTVTGIPCGWYCLEVTDNNGCVVNSGLVEICDSSIPVPTLYSFSARYGSTSTDACTGINGSMLLYAESSSQLVNGVQYFNYDGTPFDGTGYSYWSDQVSCVYGQINSNGYFYTSGVCSECV